MPFAKYVVVWKVFRKQHTRIVMSIVKNLRNKTLMATAYASVSFILIIFVNIMDKAYTESCHINAVYINTDAICAK